MQHHRSWICFLSLLTFFYHPFLMAQGTVALFDGKTFANWDGDTNRTWRIEAGAIIAGSLTERAPRNEFLATTRQFANFDLRVKFKIQGHEDINAGIQFRSERVPKHHEVSGYQADIGENVEGHLYDESRRNRMLSSPNLEIIKQAKAAASEHDWQEYRIRADGRHIQLWLNGVQTVDYIEPDPTIARSGVIALQIHGGMRGTIAYRDIHLQELPSSPAVARFGLTDLPHKPRGLFPNRKFTLETNDVLVFVGQTDGVRLRDEATLEALLAAAFAAAQPKFRNMAWEGDTVYEQWRDLNFGSWEQQLATTQASVIIAQFGSVESLQGLGKLDEFINAYAKLLDQFALRTRRIVLLSPHPFETPLAPDMPNHTAKNDILQTYSDAIQQLADSRGYVFIDLFTPLRAATTRLTVNGLHLTPAGHAQAAVSVATSLGIPILPPARLIRLRQAIQRKNQLWFENWRPMNWTFAFGDRTEQAFGKPIGNRPALRIELEAFQPLIDQADSEIHSLAQQASAGVTLPPAKPIRESSPPLPAAETQSTVDHSPEAERRSFSVAEGFEVNLFASEAQGVIKPLQMRWDPSGRLWVLCAPTYPQIEPGTKPGDFILICQDTDHDGRADKFTRFAEGLLVPMGLEFGDGGVYIGEGSELVHLKDTDGDDKADIREVILSGFGTADSHQMINGLERGLGGDLWFTQGHHAYSRVETPWGVTRLDKSGVWRYRPRSGQLDSFFNLSSAGLNCQGVTHDDWGQTFHNSGASSGGFYTVPGAIPSLRPKPYWAMALPDRRNTGIEIIGTKHLPENLQGCLVWGGFMGNSLQIHRIEDEASGFTAKALPDLIQSSRREFRPVNVRVGPDGAIYVCDWYNATIGHYQASYRDPARDKTRGRIWRVQAKGRPQVKTLDFTRMTPQELLEQLRSTERLNRHHAQGRLFDLPKAQAIAATDHWLATLKPSDPQYENLLVQAIGIYESHETIRLPLLQLLLNAQDFRARAYGTRVVGHWATRLPDPLAMLRNAIKDPQPRVRLEAIVACSYVASPNAIEIATQALDLPLDRFINYALAQAADALKPHWYPALIQGQLQFDKNPEHLRFVLESEGTQSVAVLLRELAARPGIGDTLRDQVLILLARVGSPQDLRYILDTAPQNQAILRELAITAAVHHRKPTGDLLTPTQSLLKHPTVSLRAHGLTLSGAWGLTALASTVREQLTQPENDETLYAAALDAAPSLLGREALPLIQHFIQPTQSSRLQIAAITAQAALDLPIAAQTIALLFDGLNQEKTMSETLAPLLNRQGGADALAKALQTTIPKATTAKLARRVLHGIGRSDFPLMAALHQAIGIENETFNYDPQLIKTLAQAALAQGQAQRGRAIYNSALSSCSTCHRLDGQGGDTGPELTLIGAGRSPEQLIESLLWPNRQVREGYLATTLTTRSGDLITGYKTHETPDEWQLRDPANNQIRRIAKTDIAHQQDIGSLMPQGLTAGLTREELLDLIRFLTHLGQPPNP